MISIIGANGRLGQALAKSYGANETLCPDRAIYDDWWRDGSQEVIERYFTSKATTPSTIFIAAGVLDPKVPGDIHLRVNYLLPMNVMDAVAKLGIRVVTFGTVMEQFPNTTNSYIHSKMLLGKHVAEQAGADRDVSHFQIHTLFGSGAPSPFMFLGQILDALMQATAFKMTLGRQLREYHHIDDCVQAVRYFLDSGFTGVTHISHGKPLSLDALATHIFREFDAENLLKIGALPEPASENYALTFTRPALLSEMRFRETLPAVVSYLKTCRGELEISK